MQVHCELLEEASRTTTGLGVLGSLVSSPSYTDDLSVLPTTSQSRLALLRRSSTCIVKLCKCLLSQRGVSERYAGRLGSANLVRKSQCSFPFPGRE